MRLPIAILSALLAGVWTRAGVAQHDSVSASRGHAAARSRALVLSGGEYIHPELRRRFVELAGGPHREIVYIPTASSGIRLPSGFEYEPTAADTVNPRDAQFERELAQLFGVRRVRLLHTRNRATADADTFVAALRRANGVWMSGGNSAGAIIRGSFIVRGRPDKPVLIAPGRTRGFGFLDRVAINPHLLSQKRENELITVLDTHPELVGIGISDSAGVVVRGDTVEVAGDGRVAVYDNERHGCCWYYWLESRHRFHLGLRRVIE